MERRTSLSRATAITWLSNTTVVSVDDKHIYFTDGPESIIPRSCSDDPQVNRAVRQMCSSSSRSQGKIYLILTDLHCNLINNLVCVPKDDSTPGIIWSENLLYALCVTNDFYFCLL